MSSFAVNEDWDSFRANLSSGIRATLLLVLPAAVGYLVLGEPIVRLLLEHGNTTAQSTDLVVDVLRFFVIGLVPFSLFQLFLRSFYAMQDTKTPFLINCIAVAFNVAIDFPLFAAYGVRGLAAGHAASYVLGAVVQGFVLHRRLGGIDGGRVARSALRIAAASGLMGGVVFATHRAVDSIVQGDFFVGQLMTVLVPVAVGAVAYTALTVLLKVEETSMIREVVGKRFRKERG
jgi:putative peptidoglycan lipid II flippase